MTLAFHNFSLTVKKDEKYAHIPSKKNWDFKQGHHVMTEEVSWFEWQLPNKKTKMREKESELEVHWLPSAFSVQLNWQNH